MSIEKNSGAPHETESLPSSLASPPPSRPANFLQVMGAVFWSFLGIRKKAKGERDLVTIKLPHVVAAGLLGAALLVASLLLLVRFIIRT